jgi:hypothetical protein
MVRGRLLSTFCAWAITNVLLSPFLDAKTVRSSLHYQQNPEDFYNDWKDPVTQFEEQILLERRARLETLRNSLQDELAKRAEPEEEPQQEAGDYRYQMGLDLDGKLELEWDIDHPEEKIRFRLIAEVEKQDLLAFGFSAYGEVEEADFVVMWTDYKGHHKFQVGCCRGGEVSSNSSAFWVMLPLHFGSPPRIRVISPSTLTISFDQRSTQKNWEHNNKIDRQKSLF